VIGVAEVFSFEMGVSLCSWRVFADGSTDRNAFIFRGRQNKVISKRRELFANDM